MTVGDAPTDPPAEPPAEPPVARHPQRRWIVAGAVVVVATIVLGFGALWASDVLRLDGGPRAALAERSPATTATEPTDARPPACLPGLTPDDPLRLWIGGDSLAGSLGPSLGEQTAATGIVQPVYDSRVSSGLSTPEFFDWPEHATEEMARLDPEVVVFMIGANDWKTPAPTPTDATGEPAWRGEYARRIEEMLTIFEGDTSDGRARPVYWVGSPPLQDRKQDTGVHDINAVARAVIQNHPDARYVDAYDVFADDSGRYTAMLRGLDGKSVRVRAGDGVHFTPEGGDILAADVYVRLDTLCDLDDQAVPGQAKPVLRTKGSTDVDGTTRTGGTSPTSVATTPPTVEVPVAEPTIPSTAATTPTSTPSSEPVEPTPPDSPVGPPDPADPPDPPDPPGGPTP
jgi:hypothetical protein